MGTTKIDLALDADAQAILDEACCIVADAALLIEAEPETEEPEDEADDADEAEAEALAFALANAGDPVADWISACICR